MAGIVGVIAPLTPSHRHALFNINFAMPELTKAEQKKIIRKMWFNFGRVIGEYVHTKRLMTPEYIDIEGAEYVQMFKDRGGFLISGHMGNWEIAPFSLTRYGLNMSGIYRPMNNIYLNAILQRRHKILDVVYKKGTEGARGMAATLNKKGIMAIVIDQKLREGEMVKFFGHYASTVTSYIKIAQKKDVPIILTRAIRTQGCHFKIELLPLDLNQFDRNSPNFVTEVATRINSIMESWIREHPEQWLWAHRRWPESKGEVYTPPQEV